MEPDRPPVESLFAQLKVVQQACSLNHAAFLEALRRGEDVSGLVAEARSLASAADDIVSKLRARMDALRAPLAPAPSPN